MSERAPFIVFPRINSRYLAEKIRASPDCLLGKTNITHFADGKFTISYEESTRGANVFSVQPTLPNSDNSTKLLLMVDAVKRASAKSVIAVIPYLGWARQGRKDKPRASTGAKLVADLLSVAGIDRLITMDLRADQIQGFLNIFVDHLYASATFLPYIESSKLDDLVIATPGVGKPKRANTFSKYLGVSLVSCNKICEKANVAVTMQIIGDVQGKNVVLVDDIVGTVGTVTKVANIMTEAGAKSVRMIASHCVMFDPISFRVQESGLTKMVFTDSIPYAKKCAKVKQLSIADMFAETTRRAMTNESISSQHIT